MKYGEDVIFPCYVHDGFSCPSPVDIPLLTGMKFPPVQIPKSVEYSSRFQLSFTPQTGRTYTYLRSPQLRASVPWISRELCRRLTVIRTSNFTPVSCLCERFQPSVLSNHPCFQLVEILKRKRLSSVCIVLELEQTCACRFRVLNVLQLFVVTAVKLSL